MISDCMVQLPHKLGIVGAGRDLEEGADMLMVKPALAYLDVIRVVKDAFPELPMAAYNVSGEYSMIKAAAANGWIDEAKVTLETLTSIKRAGEDELTRFSDLVNELRDTEGRRYTLRDTPLHTAIYHPAEETLALAKCSVCAAPAMWNRPSAWARPPGAFCAATSCPT